jgi:3-dehydroquinate synthetase
LQKYEVGLVCWRLVIPIILPDGGNIKYKKHLWRCIVFCCEIDVSAAQHIITGGGVVGVDLTGYAAATLAGVPFIPNSDYFTISSRLFCGWKNRPSIIQQQKNMIGAFINTIGPGGYRMQTLPPTCEFQLGWQKSLKF